MDNNGRTIPDLLCTIDKDDLLPIVGYFSSEPVDLDTTHILLICSEKHISRLPLINGRNNGDEPLDYLDHFFNQNRAILENFPEKIKQFYINIFGFLNLENSTAAGISLRRIIEEFVWENYVETTLYLDRNDSIRKYVQSDALSRDETISEAALYLIGGVTGALKTLGSLGRSNIRTDYGRKLRTAILNYINVNDIGKRRKLSHDEFDIILKAFRFASKNAHGQEYHEETFIEQLRSLIPVLQSFFKESEWEGFKSGVK